MFCVDCSRVVLSEMMIDDVTTRNGPSAARLQILAGLLASLFSRKGPEKAACSRRASRRERMKTQESGTGYPCRVIGVE